MTDQTTAKPRDLNRLIEDATPDTLDGCSAALDFLNCTLMTTKEFEENLIVRDGISIMLGAVRCEKAGGA